MNVRQIRETLRRVDRERARVRVLENLADIMSPSTETPLVVVEPKGRIRAWLKRGDYEKAEPPVRDFILTDEERIELLEWLRHTAWERKKRANELEAEIEKGDDSE